MRRFGLYAAVVLSVGYRLSKLRNVLGNGRLSNQRTSFSLSFKRSILSDDRTAASQLAFVCNQEKKDVVILLIPLDGTFTIRREAIPVAVHFYFPNDFDADTQTTDHIIIGLVGFSDGVAAFTKRCEQEQLLP